MDDGIASVQSITSVMSYGQQGRLGMGKFTSPVSKGVVSNSISLSLQGSIFLMRERARRYGCGNGGGLAYYHI